MNETIETLNIKPLDFKSIRMRADDADKWLTALRSGEYKQCEGMLYNAEKDSYCCLGVMQAAMTGSAESDGANFEAIGLPSKDWLNAHGVEFSNDAGNFDVDYEILNPSIAKYERLHGISVAASYINDVYHKSFSEIADLLEVCIERI